MSIEAKLDELAERAADSISLPHHEEDRADLYVAIRAVLAAAAEAQREEIAAGVESEMHPAVDGRVCQCGYCYALRRRAAAIRGGRTE